MTAPRGADLPCPKCHGTGRIPDDRVLGAELRRRRLKRGLGLREMAARLEFSPAYISDLELGRRAWSPSTRERYERCLK